MIFCHTDYIEFMNYNDVPVISNIDYSTRVCVSFFHESHEIDPYVSVHLLVREVGGGKFILCMHALYRRLVIIQ